MLALLSVKEIATSSRFLILSNPSATPTLVTMIGLGFLIICAFLEAVDDDQPIEREQRPLETKRRMEQRPLETKRRIKRCPAKNEKKRQGSEHFIDRRRRLPKMHILSRTPDQS